MEEQFKELLKQIQLLLKPLGYKKDGSNFRLFQEDGLGKIVNFQKSRYNDKESCSFTINVGIYFEKDSEIDKKFKEYDCQIRQRSGCIKHGNDTWWTITPQTDFEKLCMELETHVVNDVIPYLDNFISKEQVINLILDGNASKYAGTPVFHFYTARLLADMGYGDRVLPHIKNIKGKLFEKLVNEILSDKPEFRGGLV